ncbi:pentatricopeptide repeat-containing protein At4g21065 isoform X2 [Selaginella moellendorffii]|uniref:pentatricopeptide repeat-containing protein At4g21065 isoform X2 n=1 Tax=Selaginella moellendorffii TaxID=88036 RepID=UPI000D1CDFDE|nr:pentatricopeptide repeat-containing protein At4g21065 isoform X2 [Selaginella moellendorffii]|eukprot:XP_024522817.1 pentatricopeptide repeat-containing protein At4g21065 isoform X2 [Selaginella moellendorffii]
MEGTEGARSAQATAAAAHRLYRVRRPAQALLGRVWAWLRQDDSRADHRRQSGAGEGDVFGELPGARLWPMQEHRRRGGGLLRDRGEERVLVRDHDGSLPGERSPQEGSPALQEVDQRGAPAEPSHLRDGSKVVRSSWRGLPRGCLIHMYAKCGSFKFAAGVFEKMEPKNLISYTSMIQAYTHTAKHVEAYELYKKMLSEGIMPDIYAYAAALAVCPTIREGEAIHVKLGNHERRTPVCSNALVGMYGRFGRIASAKWVFDGIRYKDLASYNNMIAVFAKYDDGSKAISLYIEMEGRNLEPNLWTFTSVLDACSKLGALTEGKEIHKKVKGGDQPTDVAYNTALVNMYAKCGSTHEARAVFNDCGLKNVFTWTSLMSAYSQPGQSQYRLEAYQRMNCEGVIPDDVTFTAIFNACSHSGLPDEGLLYFRAMREDHWIVPLQPHYTCMIDLLGRVGRLREAEELVRTMPYSPDVVTWTILLSACKVYGDLKIGARAYKRITELNPPDSGPYLLMGNMYAKAGKWADVAEVKKMIKQRGLAKPPGKSMIEAQRRIHEFVCGDTAHPLNQEIRARLQEVHEQLSHAGYEPDTKEVLVDVNEEVKPELLLFHSERMALGLGLLTSDAGATLHIVKNLRICPDCHSFFKLVSKMLHRKVLVRDSHRFHIFQRGSCSCGDYW